MKPFEQLFYLIRGFFQFMNSYIIIVANVFVKWWNNNLDCQKKGIKTTVCPYSIFFSEKVKNGFYLLNIYYYNLFI